MTWRFSTINVTTVGGGGGGVGEQPTVSIDFSASTLGDAVLTSSERYYRNASGNLVATSGARFHCGTDGLVKGILLERANTGYLKRNDAFSVANGWTQKDITQTSAVRASIFGTNTAYEFDETVTSTTHNINRILGTSPDDTPSNTPICIWAIVEYVDMPYVMLMFRDKANRFPWQRFNIHPDDRTVHTASPGSATQYSSGIEYVGNDRFLIWASYDSASATTPTHPTWHLFGANAAGDAHSYAGSGRSFIVHAGGANRGYHPQMFFPVADTHVDKVGDVLTLSAGNQAVNDFYIEIPVVWPQSALLTGTPVDQFLYQSGNLSMKAAGSTVTATFGALTLTGTHTFIPGSRYVFALGKGPTLGMQLVVNGEEKDANTGAAYRADISPGNIHIGCDSNGENQFDGVIESFEMGAWE